MNDDFENSLRDSLRRGIPSAPDEPTRSEGARAYAARTRRRRAGFLAVGAAAVVVAAITTVPTVLDRSDVRGDPVAGPPQTQSPQQPVELPDQPFECPSGDGPPKPMATPPDGTIAPGAALVRVCAVQQEGTPWTPPLDALTSDVDAVATAFNDLPVAEDRMPCTRELGPAYLMVFQYPEGDTVQVRGDLYGCKLVSFGALERQGADTALSAYLEALQAQRLQADAGDDPDPQEPAAPPPCPDSAAMTPASLMNLWRPDLKLSAVNVCSYVWGKGPVARGRLDDAQTEDVNVDLRANSVTAGAVPLIDCRARLLLVATNGYGDVIVFSEHCGSFTSSSAADERLWLPSSATLDMLRSVAR